MPRALWIADRCREFGLTVVEVDGWQTRGKDSFNPGGVVCFPADVVILTRRGLVPIADVTVGDHVWTHQHRWRPVKAIGSRTDLLHELRGQGHPRLLTTATHPFLAYERRQKWENGKTVRWLEPTGWVTALEMADRWWCSPATFDQSDVPPIETLGNERPVTLTTELMWVIGHWLGDGSASGDKRHAHVTLYAPNRLGPEVEQRVRDAGLACSRHRADSVDRITFSSKPLARWFESHFGRLSHGKTLPAWVLGMDESWRRALLEGYLAADGGLIKPTPGRAARVDAVTVSKRLAIGIRLLAHSLGISTAMYLHDVPETKQWGERVFNQRPWWTVRLTADAPRQAHGRFVDGYFVAPCRESSDVGRLGEVFNLSVEEDESYVADGIVVHNCHHTADGAGEIPSLRILINGRSDLPGPLCHVGLARSGACYIIAAGRANHAGKGGWRGLKGNSAVLGIEAENRGGAGDPWPSKQLDAHYALAAALITGPGVGGDVGNVCAHKEWAPRRKPDPHSLDMRAFRAAVQSVIDHEPEEEGAGMYLKVKGKKGILAVVGRERVALSVEQSDFVTNAAKEGYAKILELPANHRAWRLFPESKSR